MTSIARTSTLKPQSTAGIHRTNTNPAPPSAPTARAAAPTPPLPPGPLGIPARRSASASTALDVRLGRVTEPSAATALVRILSSRQFAFLDAAQRDVVLDLHRRLDAEGQEHLAQLVPSDRNGQPLLLDPGPWNQTLLEHLHVLAVTKPSAALASAGVTREQILADAVRALSNPASIASPPGESGLSTCAALQQALAMRDPGRYANLLAGITGDPGSVALRQNGFLERASGTARRPDLSEPASRLLQDALLEHFWKELDVSGAFERADVLDAADVAQTFQAGAQAGLTALFGQSRAFNPAQETATAFFNGLRGWKPGTALLLMEHQGGLRAGVALAVEDGQVTVRFADGDCAEHRMSLAEAAGALRSAARSL